MKIPKLETIKEKTNLKTGYAQHHKLKHGFYTYELSRLRLY